VERGEFAGKQAIIDEIFVPLRPRAPPSATTIPTARDRTRGDVVVLQARGRNRTRDGQRYDNGLRLRHPFPATTRSARYEEYCDTERIARVPARSPSRWHEKAPAAESPRRCLPPTRTNATTGLARAPARSRSSQSLAAMTALVVTRRRMTVLPASTRPWRAAPSALSTDRPGAGPSSARRGHKERAAALSASVSSVAS
jgi:hypothetical protein